MGAGVGVHSEEDLEGLAPDEIEELRDEVRRQVAEIIRTHPRFLEEIMTSHPDIRERVKSEVEPTLRRLKG